MPLRQLFPGQGVPDDGAKVDIIAVHGLNPRIKSDSDHAWDTWRTPAGPDGRLWLRHDLPECAPESRIFLYEYNATAVYGKDRDTFIGKANELLEAIRVERDGVESRPIIFLCHSMGGLLVKQALINAHGDAKHTPTKLATSGIAFFATPHNGGDPKLVSLGGVVAKVARAAGFQKGDDVLETLKKGSIFSDIMQEQWRHQLPNYDIISFWGSLDNIVPKESTQLGLPSDRENVVKLNADHRKVCKFGSSQTDQDNLKLVRKNINDIYKKALNKNLRPLQVDTYRPVNQPIISDNELPSKGPCHYIPLPRNTQFTGRDAILDKLKSKLFIQRECQKLAIVGLGGIGKTQVVLQLAYWVKETQRDYSVFWVQALSHGSFDQDYTEITRRLGIQINPNDANPKDSVRRFLESERAGKWLLIVDNADDIEVVFGKDGDQNGVHKFLPENDRGLVLYTTRSRQVAVWAVKNEVIDLKQLDHDEAAALLKKAVIQPSMCADKERVTRLLEELCYIPLAITHAVAYLNQNQLPIRKYLDLLRGTEEDLVRIMTREFHDINRYDDSQNAIATTWIVSFEKIAKSDPLAARLLSFISCIEPKAIPQPLLPVTDELKGDIESAIGRLCGYSFLTRRGESDIFDMHALVHLGTRIWVRKRGKPRETMTDAVRHLKAVFPSDDKDNRGLWREYLPHALRALENSKGYHMQERYDLFNSVGLCLDADRRFKEAIQALEEAQKGFWSILGNDFKQSNQSGGRTKATRLFKRAVRVRWKALARRKDHDLLESGYNLASAGNNELAQKLISTLHRISSAYLDNRQIKKAIALSERVVAIRRQIFAEEDQERLASEHELARAYLDDGQFKKAILIIEHVVAIERKTLAEEDHGRITSEHVLARAFLNDKQVEKATALLEHVVAIEKKTLAEEDYRRLASEHMLACAFLNDKQVEKATALLEHVVAIEKKTLAEEDYGRLTSEHELARAYLEGENRQVQKAISILEHVVAIEKKTLAEEDDSRLTSEHMLARAYLECENRQVQKAISILEHVVAIEKKTLAEEDDSRLVSEHMLARAYLECENKQVQKAISILEHVVAVEKRLDMSDEDRLVSQDLLTEAYGMR
ncbi:TPR-like protein [Nemania abortiva]|nr:TPR-like protein [Nemania abortiva]